MIELHNNELEFSFPEVHRHARASISLIRTLRIPDDNRSHPLPPGFSRFPLRHVDDHASRVPADWRRHGGVFLPMYQAEALWILFSGSYPMAIKVAAGKIDALTGKRFRNRLHKKQDYLVLPEQPWLDGFCVQKGLIRQFVAMPLGKGYTAEEQLTGKAEHGGLQLVVYPMKAARYEEMMRQQHDTSRAVYSARLAEAAPEMGLAPGGLMRQEIYDDPYGLEAWTKDQRSRCFVHILNSAQYRDVTGSRPPHEPPTAEEYDRAGLPWFEYYEADLKAIEGAPVLAGLDSVAARQVKEGQKPGKDNEGFVTTGRHVVKLGPNRNRVREGRF